MTTRRTLGIIILLALAGCLVFFVLILRKAPYAETDTIGALESDLVGFFMLNTGAFQKVKTCMENNECVYCLEILKKNIGINSLIYINGETAVMQARNSYALVVTCKKDNFEVWAKPQGKFRMKMNTYLLDRNMIIFLEDRATGSMIRLH